MKKIVLWVMSTLTVLVLLFGYHTSTSSSAEAAGGSSALATPFTGGTGTGSGSAAGATAAPSSGTSTSGTSSSGTSSSGTSGSAATGSSGSSSTSSSAGSSTVTGSVAETRWGPVQVQLTVSNGKITNVSVLQYPDGNGKDEEINARALPVLIQETLQAQSAKIDMISGATVTSDGYVESLQSALDEAGL